MRYHKVISVIVFIVALVMGGCSNQIIQEEPEMYTSSGSIAPYTQSSFDQYIAETRAWLDDTRVFHGAGYQVEMDVVSPYRIVPDQPNGEGILFVHGLGDSPYSFVDIAPYLAKHGYLVHVMLLPGHGSRPADLMNPTNEDWRLAVEHQVNLLRDDVDKIWLGGFSTGTNLVTEYALAHPKAIQGLVLFSPAFAPKDPLVSMASIASHFVDWVNVEKEQNFTRYDSLAMHGAALYHQTAVDVQNALKDKPLQLPVLLLVTETDELIDANVIYNLFNTRFLNEDSALVWFGEQNYSDPRFVRFTMKLPDANIQSGSHISVLFRDDNLLYGRKGWSKRVDETVWRFSGRRGLHG
ncbi:Thermostable monoacylglycerol lipase [Vibrio thalassae]|uniref:Thermostable monoacylglycerol lipase n=1 Tax=Vibrio thalassae TaxID=1243014 RepID=A0A240EJF0_9VIBR|nr:alpha/beta fold hydrolase [Vibrio thalassae]SNX48631.1 Thermostable monoacylglycerol lipase [Vibrio thalassae]